MVGDSNITGRVTVDGAPPGRQDGLGVLNGSLQLRRRRHVHLGQRHPDGEIEDVVEAAPVVIGGATADEVGMARMTHSFLA